VIELDSITVQNFGPFLGETSVDFGGNHGVYVIYANNEHGKTMLLNAFRWAFTGQALGKNGPILNQNLINRDAIRNSGDSTLETQVTVKFQVDSTSYEVRRKLTRPSGGAPKMTLHLVEDGQVLSKENAPKRLNEILPAEIQQFFFFDAELINQFEFLLDHKARAASQLKDSIEVALGIPVLRGASETLRRILDKTMKDQTKRERQSAKAKDIAKTIADLQKKVTPLQEGIEEAKATMRDANNEMGNLEVRLKENKVTQGLIQERTGLEGQLEGLKTSADRALNGQRDAAADGWRALLNDVMVEQIATLDKREAIVSQDLARIRRDDLITELRRECIKKGECPICKKVQPKSKQETNQEDRHETTHLEEELQRIRARARVLERLGSRSARSHLASAVAANTEALDALSRTESAISDLEEKLTGVDEADVREVSQKYGDQKLILNTATDLRKDLEDNLTELRKNIDTLTGRLIREGAGQEIGLKARIDLITDLIGFFNQAADDYREDQKNRVEKAATEIFLSTAEHVEGIEGLRITDNYGLEIVQLDGTVEQLRSSGIEHIIAVSLIGALQETSPVRGPVVMDSPFGRLDSDHSDRVMKLIPNLAPQVLLMPHDKELEVGGASDVLDPSQIIAERKLRKISRNQTVLEPLGEGSR